jgi:NAD(P)-dependent dehydrogenase (short-subunit alcohol dehydrogenase family)
MTFHPDSLPDLTGKVYIVTGGNSGMLVSSPPMPISVRLTNLRGYYTVARLAEHRAHVYLCARSITKGNNAIARIKTLYPQAHITLLEIDHLSLASVVSTAKMFLSKETVLHGLINNAGIMCAPFQMTKDGYEAQWQTNYLAHWVLTSHLLPLMLSTARGISPGSVRIVNLSSSGHYSAPRGGISFSDTSLMDSSPLTRYGQSKLANILHTKTLNKLYGPESTSKVRTGEIWTAAVHPGLVKSELTAHDDFPSWMKTVGKIVRALGLEADGDVGSWTSLFCVASPEMRKEQSGTYFQRIAEVGWQSAMAKDQDLAAKLENWTKKEIKKGGWVE